VTFRSAIGFGLGASLAAAVGAAALFPWLSGDDRLASAWATKGFLAMAMPGLVGGAWLAHEHGRPSPRFLIALAMGFFSRLVLAGLAAFFATKAGAGAALIAGLAAGFVPLTAFEMVWFMRAPGSRRLGSEPRG
jgi:hypothetical protein